MASSFLLLYYTNVVGLEAAAIGTMFLLIRFYDAFADLVVGRLVDAKKPGRLGKFRPFILWFSLPLLLSSMAIFSANTFFPDMDATRALVYAYVTYAVMGTFYSLVNIPYGSIAPAMTQVPTERAALASWRVWGSNITILMLSFVVAPQIKRFTGDPVGLQRALFITTAIFVVVGMALYLFTVATVKEQVQRDVAAPTLKESFGTLRKNRPLVWLCLGSLAFLTGLTALGTLAAYYALYVLNDAQFIAWNAVAQAAGTFLVASFIPKIVRSFGKRNGYIALGVVGMVAGLLLAFGPPTAARLRGCILPVGHRHGRRQHADVGARGGHGRVRRVEDRSPHRGDDLRPVLLHPQDGPGHRWRCRRLRARLCRLQLARGQERHPAKRRHHPGHSALVRPAGHRLHPPVAGDHVLLPAHRQGVPPDRQRDRGPPGRARRDSSPPAGGA